LKQITAHIEPAENFLKPSILTAISFSSLLLFSHAWAQPQPNLPQPNLAQGPPPKTGRSQFKGARQNIADKEETTPTPAAPSGPAINPDSKVITNHQVTIRGKVIPYTAETGTQPVWNEKDKAVASLFYVFYQRSDVKDRVDRPLLISFNGGPGSASLWMQIGYTGPRLLKLDSEGYPLQPSGLKENPHSLLDIADIVYVDPVNTGFSRIIGDADRTQFFGVNQDIGYLATWIQSFINRHDRWLSPKYLIGESYGTTRASGLALELQDSQWIHVNGVILVAPTDLGITREGPVNDASHLPYYAATAWYHKKLPADLQSRDLDQVLPEVELFTINELIPALSQGGFLPDERKKALAARYARYSGLPVDMVQGNNLKISTNQFWKELLRDQGYTIGRLDSRYLGIDRRDAGERPDYNAELPIWENAFTPAFNDYLSHELNYKTDARYNVFGSVGPWDNTGNNTGENLRAALAQSPQLQVLIQAGYYDGGCDYFNSKYSMWQLDPSGKMKDRIHWKGYRGGHMMYLVESELATSTRDIRDFIIASLPAGKVAKYTIGRPPGK
jgi:carboxypeptidase C (cathepsin A)